MKIKIYMYSTHLEKKHMKSKQNIIYSDRNQLSADIFLFENKINFWNYDNNIEVVNYGIRQINK